MNPRSTAPRFCPHLLVIGASTGGPGVLTSLLSQLPPLRAGVLIVQHMPKFINGSFVRTLGRNSQVEVRLAQHGDALGEGVIHVAPSEVHCELSANRLICLRAGPQVNFVCPSIDVTLQSLGKPAPAGKLVAVLLTGMGRDGASGLAHVKSLGGMTIAQDEASCAVYGMPAAAVRLGCVDHEMPPASIARFLAHALG
jgi:two-component system chemotaxis response regulator CheB